MFGYRPEYFKFEAKVGAAPLRIKIERGCRYIRISGPPRGQAGEKEAQIFLRALLKFSEKLINFEGARYRGRAGKETISSITLDLN